MDAPGAWLRRVIINLLIDAHRRRASERAALERMASVDEVVFDDPVAGPWWDAVRAPGASTGSGRIALPR